SGQECPQAFQVRLGSPGTRRDPTGAPAESPTEGLPELRALGTSGIPLAPVVFSSNPVHSQQANPKNWNGWLMKGLPVKASARKGLTTGASRDRRRCVLELDFLENRTLLASGLVAAYGFNEGSGTTVGDASGNGNIGTISNATWVQGNSGSGLKFTGATNSYV